MTYNIKVYDGDELVHEETDVLGLEVTSDLGNRIEEYPDLDFDRVEIEVAGQL